jgi:Leucine-rich repeat (LRR) protein
MKRLRTLPGTIAVLCSSGVLLLCSCSTERKRGEAALLEAAGVPGDLLAHQQHLESLALPSGLRSLAWLDSRGLENLALGELDSEAVKSLPATLVTLRVRSYSTFETLDGLPESLESVGIPFGGLNSLGVLPSGLRELELHRVRRLEASRLPRTLQRLSLRETSIRDSLDFPDSLVLLRLEGSGVESLDGLPPGVTALALTGTRVRSLEPLPPRLHALELRDNPLLDPLQLQDLPRYLVELSLYDQSPGDLTELPATLRLLRVRGSWDPPAVLGKLPPTLAELDLELNQTTGDPDRERAALCSLPVHLRVLKLRSASRMDPRCLPSDLLDLHLEGLPHAVLPALPSGLHRLAIPQSIEIVTADLETVPSGLVALDLSYTGVKDLSPLVGRLPSLKELKCRGCLVERISALPRSLERLDLAGSRYLRTLEGSTTSPQLQALNLGGTAVESLAGVPSSVTVLDISGTPLRSLDHLPPNLQQLTIGAGQLRSLDGLPATVRHLSIVSIRQTKMPTEP